MIRMITILKHIMMTIGIFMMTTMTHMMVFWTMMMRGMTTKEKQIE